MYEPIIHDAIHPFFFPHIVYAMHSLQFVQLTNIYLRIYF